ncbi:MAG: hypothetical protein LBF12_05870 [Christensenellaceae bacterium]|jgi:spoIIIJ-associated protein|nr:hypothetical protein [Christensenellaceae bacterium]
MEKDDTITNIGVEQSIESQNLQPDTDDGKKEARTPEYLNEVAQKVTEFVMNLLEKMNITSTVATTIVDGEINVQISGYGAAQAIGFKGEVLDAIQYFTLVIANKKDTEFLRVLVNAGTYRERRTESLKNLALQKAYKASVIGHRIPLEPMNPFERRIIHSALINDQYARTESQGEGKNRHVVIIPHIEKKSYGYGNKPQYNRNSGSQRGNYNSDRRSNYGDNRSSNRPYNKPYGEQRPQQSDSNHQRSNPNGFNRYNNSNQQRTPYNSNQQRPYNNQNPNQSRPYNPNQQRPYNPNQQRPPYNSNQSRPYNPNQQRPYNPGYNRDRSYNNQNNPDSNDKE